MEQFMKRYALHLWGEYVRLVRIQKLDMLQHELGILLDYSPTAAKQAVSQIEHGRSWIPKNKYSKFVEVLQLDEGLFRQLDYLFNASQYNRMAAILTDLLRNEFDHRPFEPEHIHPSTVAVGISSPPAPTGELVERLQMLKAAYEQHLIEDNEYEDARKRVLEQFVEGN